MLRRQKRQQKWRKMCWHFYWTRQVFNNFSRVSLDSSGGKICVKSTNIPFKNVEPKKSVHLMEIRRNRFISTSKAAAENSVINYNFLCHHTRYLNVFIFPARVEVINKSQAACLVTAFKERAEMIHKERIIILFNCSFSMESHVRMLRRRAVKQ